MTEIPKIVVVVPAALKVVKAVRDITKDFLISNGVVDADTIYDLELVVAEALINIVKHTYKFDLSQLISYTIEMKDGSVEIKIRDFGPKINLKELKPRELSEPREGGLGLHLIRTLVDNWEYEEVRKGNLLFMRRRVF